MTTEDSCSPDFPRPSVPSQPSSEPSPPSWRLSEVQAVVDVLDHAKAVLTRVALTEGPRPTGRLAHGARDQVEHALEHVHTLLRIVSR